MLAVIASADCFGKGEKIRGLSIRFFSSWRDALRWILSELTDTQGWEARVPYRHDACVPIREIRVIRG